MFEPKKRRTPLPCSSRRRPVARAASPRTAYRVRMQGADQWRRNRRAARRRGRAARKRQEGGKKRRGVLCTSREIVRTTARPACRVWRHARAGHRDSGGNPIGAARPHGTRANCAAGRGIAFARRQAAYAAGEKGKGARGAAPASRLECGKRRAARATRRGETPHGGRRSATERNDRNRNAAPTAAPECSIRAPPPAARRTRRARAPRSDSDRIRRARAPRRSRSGCAPTGTSRCRRSYRRRP
ncbi:transcriptional regulator, MarR family domain protein [Burkholderia pseudomallei MSHR4300]|nr:transcriptional regulator, MarR family domain protein [Burkholderia pseudomallei MSHR4300]